MDQVQNRSGRWGVAGVVRGAVGAVCAAGMVFGAASAVAGTARAFVSITGSDANTSSNCNPAAPCRSFGAAASVLNPGGEIVVLTSGGYGPVTISQAMNITAPQGIYAGVTVSSGDGITVNAPGATVRLSGITINGQGGTNGINVVAVGDLEAQNLTIMNLTNGISATAPGAFLRISNSSVKNNMNAGITASSSSTPLVINLNTVNVDFNGLTTSGNGIDLGDNVVADVQYGDVVGNGGWGIAVTGSGSDTKTHLLANGLNLTRNVTGGITLNGAATARVVGGEVVGCTLMLSGTSTGVSAGGYTTIYANSNLIVGGGTGLSQVSPAIFYTNGSNNITFTTTQTSGTLSSLNTNYY